MSIPFRPELAERLKGHTSEVFFSDPASGTSAGVAGGQAGASGQNFAGTALSVPVEARG